MGGRIRKSSLSCSRSATKIGEGRDRNQTCIRNNLVPTHEQAARHAGVQTSSRSAHRQPVAPMCSTVEQEMCLEERENLSKQFNKSWQSWRSALCSSKEVAPFMFGASRTDPCSPPGLWEGRQSGHVWRQSWKSELSSMKWATMFLHNCTAMEERHHLLYHVLPLR